jgi:hypothetical protein
VKRDMPVERGSAGPRVHLEARRSYRARRHRTPTAVAYSSTAKSSGGCAG